MSKNENKSPNIELAALKSEDVEDFVLANQRSFNYGALEEFGLKDEHFEEEGQIISRKTILNAIDKGEAYNILSDGVCVGGVVVNVNGDYGELELLFTLPEYHSKGIGYRAWCSVEKLYPNVKVWQTLTPYFEKRNIHFYVNRCGFHIVEFYNSFHQENRKDNYMDEEMFRFEKVIK